VPEDEIRPVPEIGGSDAAECLKGLATVSDQLIALVSVERIIAPITVH
jgi:chemotaxis signal transduction protein